MQSQMSTSTQTHLRLLIFSSCHIYLRCSFREETVPEVFSSCIYLTLLRTGDWGGQLRASVTPTLRILPRTLPQIVYHIKVTLSRTIFCQLTRFQLGGTAACCARLLHMYLSPYLRRALGLRTSEVCIGTPSGSVKHWDSEWLRVLHWLTGTPYLALALRKNSIGRLRDYLICGFFDYVFIHILDMIINRKFY